MPPSGRRRRRGPTSRRASTLALRALATITGSGIPRRQAIRLFRQHPGVMAQAAIWRERFAVQFAEGLAELGSGSSPTLVQLVKASVAVHTVGLCTDRWLRDEGATGVADLAEVAVAALR